MPLLLDTTVVVDLLRDRPAAARVAAYMAAGEIPYICAVTAEEVQRGLRRAEVARAARVLTSFRVAPLGIVEGGLAGTWRRQFGQRGITLSQADCLIAASAVGVHAVLATGNPKHFAMDGVTVAHWPVGE